MERDGVSYTRYSFKRQEKGDSEGRQDREFLEFCRTHGLNPVEKTDYADRGASGFKGEHIRRGRLKQLIEDAGAGKFRPGTVIVVEAWDRLGRLPPDEQTALVFELLKTGVSIGVCRLGRIFTREGLRTDEWITLQAFIVMAYNESKQKSVRVGSAWKEKRRRARAGEHQRPTESMGPWSTILTKRFPLWIRLGKDDKPELIPEKAKVVRLVFRLAGKGYGVSRMAAKLHRDGVVPLNGTVWSKSVLGRLMGDRRVLGEMELCGEGRRPDGEPVKDYFPRVVSDDEWAAARAGAKARKHERGPVGGKVNQVNLFQSLVKDAKDGGAYFMIARQGRKGHTSTGRGTYALQNLNSTNGLAKCRTFPHDVFEAALLRHIEEVNPAEVVGVEDQGPNLVDVLEGQLSEVMTELAEIKADLAAKRVRYSAMLANRVADLEESKGRLEREIEVARHQASHPLEEAWQEGKSLVEVVLGAQDVEEAKLRLRAVLRRIVEKVVLLVVPRGTCRLAAVQVKYTGGEYRDIIIVSRRPVGNGNGRTSGRWYSRTFFTPSDWMDRPGDEVPMVWGDLSGSDGVEVASQYLEGLTTEQIAAMLEQGHPVGT
jgi:DNA invertase Pin-like site-specific DNA recombinase